MNKIKNKKIFCGIAAGAALLLCIILVCVIVNKNNATEPGGESGMTDSRVTSSSDTSPTAEPTTEPTTAATEPPTTEPPTTEPTETEPSATEPGTPPPEPNVPSSAGEFSTVDMSYFSDALFIGDSRTDGIRLYSGIASSGAQFFTGTGLSVYNLELARNDIAGAGDNLNLRELLTAKKYGKIYLMLGVNECGYDISRTTERYGQILGMIRENQPGAIIYVCANLHVTQYRSDTDPSCNNVRLNELNCSLSGYADGVQVFYIDVNPVFDDENGALRADYAFDSAHMYSSYYVYWAQFLCTHAIVR